MKLSLHTQAQTNSTLKEDGAVCAGDIAGTGGAYPLFSRISRINQTQQAVSYTTGSSTKPKKKKKKSRLMELFAGDKPTVSNSPSTHPDPTDYDEEEVMSRLKSFADKDKVDQRDTVTFGLEDDENNTVKVTVSRDDAEPFSKYLDSLMSSPDDNGRVPEIAEILFKARNEFDIIDIDWPDMEEDEETSPNLQGLSDPNNGNQQENGDANGEQDLNAAPQDGEELPPTDAGEEQVGGLLAQVIDMMKADASARAAEARAKEAEARAREASAVVQQAMTKVKQEEQYLDMSAYNDARKTEDKEAKRLAQLAKWKSDMKKEGNPASDEDDFDLGQSINTRLQHGTQRNSEEEEHTRTSSTRKGRFERSDAPLPAAGRFTTKELTDLISRRTK